MTMSLVCRLCCTKSGLVQPDIRFNTVPIRAMVYSERITYFSPFIHTNKHFALLALFFNPT